MYDCFISFLWFSQIIVMVFIYIFFLLLFFVHSFCVYRNMNHIKQEKSRKKEILSIQGRKANVSYLEKWLQKNISHEQILYHYVAVHIFQCVLHELMCCTFLWICYFWTYVAKVDSIFFFLTFYLFFRFCHTTFTHTMASIMKEMKANNDKQHQNHANAVQVTV